MMNKRKLPHDHGQAIERNFTQIPYEEFEIISEIFKLLGDSSRLRIFWLLCHCEECVINISAMMEMSSPAVSHHLKLLAENGLVQCRRDGKEVYYKAAETEKVKLLHSAVEKMEQIACIQVQENGGANMQAVERVHELMTENPEKRFTIEELSRISLMNTSLLKSMFKKRYGNSIAAYMKQFRVEKAKQMLAETDISIADIAVKQGYKSQSKFTEAFKTVTQMLPTDYRKMNSKSEI